MTTNEYSLQAIKRRRHTTTSRTIQTENALNDQKGLEDLGNMLASTSEDANTTATTPETPQPPAEPTTNTNTPEPVNVDALIAAAVKTALEEAKQENNNTHTTSAPTSTPTPAPAEPAPAPTEKPRVATSEDMKRAREEKYGTVFNNGSVGSSGLRATVAAVNTEPAKLQLWRVMNDAFDLGADDVYVEAGTPIRLKIKDGLDIYTGIPAPDSVAIEDLMHAIVPSNERGTLMRKRELNAAYTVPDGKHMGRRCRLNVAYATPGDTNQVLTFRLLSNYIGLPSEYGTPDTITRHAHDPNGAIIVSGPTGSGKTTLCASLLREIQLNGGRIDKKTGRRLGQSILTLESPVEYLFDNNDPNGNGTFFIQREVGSDTHSFINGLNSGLRQHPNTILVGEIREPEEIQAFLSAAKSGHLTITTVHANDCAGIIERIATAYSDPNNPNSTSDKAGTLLDLANNTRLLVTQNLVETIDEGRVPVHEILEISTSDEWLIDAITNGDTTSIRRRLEASNKDMNAKLLEVCRADTGNCYIESARKLAPNKRRFDTLRAENENNGISYNYHPDTLKNI
jgi:Tfp pilus assembly pilus retraction ATPase PilT